MNRRTEKGWPYKLRSLLATLPPGRHRVAWALLADPFGATYREVALRLGLNIGTVYEHVRRIRLLEDVTHRRLRHLWEHGVINRWAFPGIA